MPQPTFGDAHVDAALTNISVAYVQDASNFIASQVFPTIPVEHASDKYFIYTQDDFFRDEYLAHAVEGKCPAGVCKMDT